MTDSVDFDVMLNRLLGAGLVSILWYDFDMYEDDSKYCWRKGSQRIGPDVHDVGPPGGASIMLGVIFTIDVGI